MTNRQKKIFISIYIAVVIALLILPEAYFHVSTMSRRMDQSGFPERNGKTRKKVRRKQSCLRRRHFVHLRKFCIPMIRERGCFTKARRDI